MNPMFEVKRGALTLSGEAREGDSDGDGDGDTPLVLVHGFGGSRRDWDEVLSALPADRPVISYDQRGFGASTAPEDEPFSHAEDLALLLDARGIARADLCGMSLGGATALSFALDRPEQVRRLVLVSPLMAGWSWSADWIERWKAIGRKARAGEMEAARDFWWHHPLFDEVRKLPVADAMRARIARFPGRQWVLDAQRPVLPDVDRLTALAVPTLLLTGERDTEDFRLIAELVEQAAPRVTRIDFPDAGHMLDIERPREVADAIAAFLRAADQ